MVDLRGEFIVAALMFLCPLENSDQKHVQYLKNMRCVRLVGKKNHCTVSELFKMSSVQWAEQLSQNKMAGLLLHFLRVLLDSTAGINTVST
jgi:hypothetical protein